MIELDPIFESGEKIKIEHPVKQFRLGRKEISKSLRTKIEKVSKDHVEFTVDYSQLIVTVKGFLQIFL